MTISLPYPYQNADIRTADVTQTMMDLYTVVQQINAGLSPPALDPTLNTLTVIGNTVLGGSTSGSSSLEVLTAASQVNRWQMRGQTTGSTPLIAVVGSDTDISARYRTKGAGAHKFETNAFDNIQLQVSHVANAVNYVQVNGGATGTGVLLSAQGSDAAIEMAYTSKGSFGHAFSTNGTYAPQFKVAHVANAVNWVQVTGNATGGGVTVSAQGSDAAVPLQFASKGTSPVSIYTNGAAEQFRVTHTANAANYINVSGASAGNGPAISAAGSDTNATLNFSTKGTFGMGFYTNGFNQQQFSLAHTANAVNRIEVTGGAAGSRANFSAQGSDSNIGIFYNAKGTENHVFTSNSGSLQFVIAGSASTVNWLQVTGSGVGAGVTISSTGSDTNIDIIHSTKGSGNHLFNNGYLSVATVGAGLRVKEGSNAKQGTAVLVGGTVTVANTSVTANSRILVTSQVDGGTPGFLRVASRVNGTSFTVTSSSGTDTSTVAYQIFEPA